MTVREGSLCTGYNGLGMAVQAVFGDVELAFVADKDPAATALLAHRYPGVPNLGDITTVDWTKAPPVDILTAGYPCQGESYAGKRLGADDERWIWEYVFAAIRDLRPRHVFLENVAGHLSLGFWRVLGDLASIGFDAQWMCLRASDIGAAHRRDRVFIYAYPAEAGQGVATPGYVRGGGTDTVLAGAAKLMPTPTARDAERALAHYPDQFTTLPDAVAQLLPTPRASAQENRQTKRTPSQLAGKHGLSLAAEVCELLPTPRAIALGQEENPQRWLERNAELAASRSKGASGMPLGVALALLPTPRATDGVNGGPNQRSSHGGLALPASVQPERWGKYAAAIARWEAITGRTAPEPTEPGKNGPRLATRFVEWLMGLPPGWVTDVPGISRNEVLRLLGNGLMPQQGAHAFSALANVPATAGQERK